MKLKLIAVGKTDSAPLKDMIGAYESRLRHYVPFEMLELPDLKKTKHLSKARQKEQEADLLLKHLTSGDVVVLFDEKGEQCSSRGFSAMLQKTMNGGARQVCFLVGGPYGFGEKAYQRADRRISLSQMTFPHQMVRLFIVEQLYRAFSILRNEPYHHD